MPRLAPDKNPAHRLHKQSGQGIVTLDGKGSLLGPYRSDEANAKYDALIVEWHHQRPDHARSHPTQDGGRHHARVLGSRQAVLSGRRRK